ncbi:MAG: filamentous hemagglutinin protein [Herbaspirillum sp.]|nr:filamentous hemagglutinin protein [Herbaspirillum sp.]
MNKQAYRVIFNRRRGIMMAVAESVSGRTQQKNGAHMTTGAAARARPLHALAALGVLVAGLFGGVTVAQAQIVADPGAGGRRPTVDRTANGRPLVQIVTPSAAGVSHNRYQQFNVDRQGAILNNARQLTRTQQGGLVNGNPYLQGGAARIILNEVTGAGRSQLRGYTEVAGQRAEVIIANPNGISCSGCGFINASRGTLTTGTPVFGGDGSLAAFRVRRGDIQIGSGGLNAGNLDRLDLIARSVQVNGQLWADRLNVVAGANQVDAENLGVQIIEGEGGQPTVAIDTALMGGMYANKIRLVGTGAGMGVVSLGAIAAHAGQLNIDSRGKVTLRGDTRASERIAIRSDDDVVNAGTLYGRQTVQIDSAGTVDNSGTLAAQGDLDVHADRIASSGNLTAGLDVAGEVSLAGNLHMHANQTLDATGRNSAGGHIAMHGASVNLAAAHTIAGGDISVRATAGDIDHSGGALQGGKETMLNATGTVSNIDGLIQGAGPVSIFAGAALDNRHGQIAANDGRLTVAAGAGLDNRDGKILANGAQLTASAGTTFDNRYGQIEASGDLFTVTAASVDNTQGRIVHSGIGATHVDGGAVIVNDGGTIGGHDITLASAALRNTLQGRIVAAGNLQLAACNRIDNSHGAMFAAGDLIVHESEVSLHNIAGEIGATGNVKLTIASLDNTDGHIGNTAGGDGRIDLAVGAAAGTLRATRGDGMITNTGGTIGSAADLRITAQTLAGDGNIIAGQDLNIAMQGDYLLTAGNRIAANRDLYLSTKGDWTNAGDLSAVRHLNLSARNLENRYGALINAGGGMARITVANQLHNIGRIYGDDIAIGAHSVLNDGLLNADGSTREAGVIAARNGMQVGAIDIVNREHAMLQSLGDMAFGRSLDVNDQATGAGDSLLNASATIDAGGNLALHTANLTNTNAHFATAVLRDDSLIRHIREYQLNGSSRRYSSDEARQSRESDIDKLVINGGRHNDYTIFDYVTTTDRTVVTQTDPGKIAAGGNIRLAGIVTNDKSAIIAGRDIVGSVTAINNLDFVGQTTVTQTGYAQYHDTKKSRTSSRKDNYHSAVAFKDPITTTAGMNIFTVQAYGAPDHAENGAAGADVHARIVPGSQSSTVEGRTVPLPPLVLPSSPLFQYHPEPGHPYLIETDPQFTNSRIFLSSDYQLSRLAADPQRAHQRLGDGFYEQKLINDQIAQLTGRRFLGGYTSNETQYQALMDNGVAAAARLQLTPGTALSEAEIAALTADIVWLVEQDVRLPDGAVTSVWAPVVYLAKADAGIGDVPPAGSLIGASNLDLTITGAFQNGGTLQAVDRVSLQAADIVNTGAIAGTGPNSAVSLTAANDIVNRGGSIAGHQVELAAGRDVTIASTTATSGVTIAPAKARRGLIFTEESSPGFGSEHTVIDRLAGVAADQLSIQSGRDIQLSAAQIAVTGDATLTAGRDLQLQAATTKQSVDYTYDASNHLRQSETQVIGTQIETGGNLGLAAGQDLGATAAYVNAGKAMTAVAGRDVTLDAARQDSHYDQEIYTESSGLLSSSSIHVKDKQQSRQAIGATFSGDSVQIAAGRDINVAGSNIVGTHDVALTAANDIHIGASQNTNSQSYFKEEFTSGLFSGGGVGVTVGSKEQQNTQTIEQTTHNGSMIGSTGGNVQLIAGNRYMQTGSDIVALDGDIGIAAKSVDIAAVQDIAIQTSKEHTEQSGLTLGVSAPIISAVQTVRQMQSASGKTDDPRMKALAAATAVSAAGTAATAAQDPSQGVTVSLTVGSSRSDSESKQTTSTAVGSNVKAGGNVVIAAVGDGRASHLNVVGSDIDAGQNAILKADGDINLRAAQSTSDQHSTSSSSAAVGIAATYGSNGFAFGITANAAGSRGKADGSDVVNINSHVAAGNSLILESGHDTNLAGAVASAKQVIANVGTSGQGNFNIQSLQDTSSYKSKDQNIGGSVTIGYGASGSFNIGQSKVDADYASVGEQSGIKAGDGGFIVNVNGNTDLAGGVIASTATEDKNLLITKTLTQSDIENHSRYDASSISIGGGYGKQANAGGNVQTFAGGTTGTAGGFSSTEGNTGGTSRSGISAGTIVISDDQQQQQMTGRTADATIAGINRDVSADKESAGSVGKDWNGQQLKDKVTAESQISASFGAAASKEIGSYATKKYDEAMAKGDTEEAAKWVEGGSYRVALHTGVGALTGGAEGAAGAFTSAKSMSAIAEVIDTMDLPEGVKQGLAQVVATGLGAAVGGGAGAVAGLNVEANNRQLHESEIKWIEKNKESFAQTLADELGRAVTEQEAMAWLSMAGEGNVDRTYQTANGNQLGSQATEERQAYNVAKQYIAQNAGDSFVDDRGQQQQLFVAKGGDFNNANINSQYRNNKVYRDFYWNVRGDNLKPDNPTPQELATYNEREKIRLENAVRQLARDAIPAVMTGATGAALNATGKASDKSTMPVRREISEAKVQGRADSAGAGVVTSEGTADAASGLNLSKSLTSEQQLSELTSGGGSVMAGNGSNEVLRDAPRLVSEYGGSPSDWSKVGSSSATASDGTVFEIHAYRNAVTGQVVEPKTIQPIAFPGK